MLKVKDNQSYRKYVIDWNSVFGNSTIQYCSWAARPKWCSLGMCVRQWVVQRTWRQKTWVCTSHWYVHSANSKWDARSCGNDKGLFCADLWYQLWVPKTTQEFSMAEQKNWFYARHKLACSLKDAQCRSDCSHRFTTEQAMLTFSRRAVAGRKWTFSPYALMAADVRVVMRYV